MERKLKVLDLFAGIGGFALGLDSTDFFETVKFVEKDKYCQKVLQKNFPNIPIEEDIKNVKGKEYSADVVVGGFPCQPFSVAGKQKGTDDDRYLWPEMLRLIREIKPEFVIGENVQGIINIQNGMVLRQVCDDLENEGFEVQCFLIPASGIGAWHQRYRVWIVGHSEHNGSLASKIKRRDTETATRTQEGKNETSEPERTSGSRDNEDVSNTDTRLSIGENEEVQTRRDTVDSSSKNVSNTHSGLRGGGRAIQQSGENKVWRFYFEEEEQARVDIRSETIGRDAVSRKDVSDTEHERLQGRHKWNKREGWEILSSKQKNRDEVWSKIRCTDGVQKQKTWWQTQSDLCGVPNGISYELDKDRANRIKTLGNAIVPQIAREFGLAIKKVLSDSDSDGQGGQQF